MPPIAVLKGQGSGMWVRWYCVCCGCTTAWVWSQHTPAVLASGTRRQKTLEFKVILGSLGSVRLVWPMWHCLKQRQQMRPEEPAGDTSPRKMSYNGLRYLESRWTVWMSEQTVMETVTKWTRHTPPGASSVPSSSSLGTTRCKPGASVLFKKQIHDLV